MAKLAMFSSEFILQRMSHAVASAGRYVGKCIRVLGQSIRVWHRSIEAPVVAAFKAMRGICFRGRVTCYG